MISTQMLQAEVFKVRLEFQVVISPYNNFQEFVGCIIFAIDIISPVKQPIDKISHLVKASEIFLRV